MARDRRLRLSPTKARRDAAVPTTRAGGMLIARFVPVVSVATLLALLVVSGASSAASQEQVSPPPSAGIPQVAATESAGMEAAASKATATVRDIGRACPQGVPSSGLADVVGSTHAAAIDCIVWWEVSRGTTASTYSPASDVKRGQMASFIAAAIVRAGGSLPTDAPDAFDDDDGGFHERAIDQLAAVGVVSGSSPGRFEPGASVTRAQMATFLVRAFEYHTGMSLVAEDDYFADDTGNTHEANINAAAAAGFAGGTAPQEYAPQTAVNRAQMASFLARMLDLLVTEHGASPPEVPDAPIASAVSTLTRSGFSPTTLEPRGSTITIVNGDTVEHHPAALYPWFGDRLLAPGEAWVVDIPLGRGRGSFYCRIHHGLTYLTVSP